MGTLTLIRINISLNIDDLNLIDELENFIYDLLINTNFKDFEELYSYKDKDALNLNFIGDSTTTLMNTIKSELEYKLKDYKDNIHNATITFLDLEYEGNEEDLI